MLNKNDTTLLFINFLTSTLKAKEAIIYSYTRHINGFAAMLDEKEAAEIASKEYNLIQFSGFLYWWFYFPLFLSLVQAKFMAVGTTSDNDCVFTYRGSKSNISLPKPTKKTAHNPVMGISWAY